MKAECVKEKIQTAVSLAEKFASRNVSLPILSCILIEAENSNLIIKSTNLDIGFECKIPARITGSWKVAVSGTILGSFLSNFNEGGNITIQNDQGNLIVDSKKNKTIIKGMAADDFPAIPKVIEGDEIMIPAQNLIKALKSVYFSASNSNVRPELSSVLITSDDDGLICVATDSFRLAEKKVKLKKIVEIPPILIPFKNVQEIIKVLEVVGGDIKININKNQISFDYGNGYIVSRLVEGNFPDYKQIIPKEFSTEAIVLKKDLINALKLSTVFSDKFNQVKVSVSPKNKDIEISSMSQEVGEVNNNIEASISGEAVSLNFNHKYLADCFQVLDTDSISISFNGPSKPVIISGVGDRSFTYLVMPMNR